MFDMGLPSEIALELLPFIQMKPPNRQQEYDIVVHVDESSIKK
jgi:hypothetical protein